MSRYKKILIIPYFGKFNNYFPLWLKSCECNKEFEWLIYTDDQTAYKYPSNVHVKYTTFKDIKEKAQLLVDFPIVLESPYKLCDWRPAYGELFKEDIEKYDFWGYCDTDLIWGNLSMFYTDEILEKYDKISDAGHFTLYKNNEQMRTAYKKLSSAGCLDYKEVYSNSLNYAFDEWGKNKGINRILLNNGFSIYYKPIVFADIKISTYGLLNTRSDYDLKERRTVESKKHNIVYIFDKGNLFQYALDENGNMVINQEAYVHLQKRPMKISSDMETVKRFAIVPPNKFEAAPDHINIEYLKENKENRIYWHYYHIRWNNFKRKLKKKFIR